MNDTTPAPAERRLSFPRVRFDALVEILPAQQALVHAKMYDISPNGIQIRCNKATADTLPFIAPSRTVPHGSETVVRLVIQIDPESLEINARCRCCYAITVTDGEIAMGLEFIQITEDSRSHLNAFIERAIEP